jgi:predicted dithiol-disulfide oxidoreductase (DUF899 family)
MLRHAGQYLREWNQTKEGNRAVEYTLFDGPNGKESLSELFEKRHQLLVYHYFESEGPGTSVFYKDENGNIFHTYSTYARGLDILIGAYNLLDLVPKGRDEADLPWKMAWIRHHDKYDE